MEPRSPVASRRGAGFPTIPSAGVLLSETYPSPITLRPPRVADAAGIWRLVRDSGALDLNSPYAYLLVCRHHQRTCVVAEEAGRLVGFVTAYVPPATPDVIFIWQLGVAASHRRHGLGRRLVAELLARCPDARFLECTVTPSNTASLQLFRTMAAARHADFDIVPGFAADDFPPEVRAPEREDLIRVGPLPVRTTDLSDAGRSAAP